MAVIVWNEKFRTGNPDVDRQHQKLFKMVNDLHDAIISGTGKGALIKTLDGLAEYVVVHFRTEERLMAEKAYPGYRAHKAQHDRLTKEATEVISGFKSGKITLTMTLSRFLADWIKNHIQGEDIGMIDHIRNGQQDGGAQRAGIAQRTGGQL